ncbi:MAG TPA: hypothetical protein VLR45_00270 [Desulfoprunum sp.]|nr:hypothetical protein [Desulfoprunum sp.]
MDGFGADWSAWVVQGFIRSASPNSRTMNGFSVFALQDLELYHSIFWQGKEKQHISNRFSLPSPENSFIDENRVIRNFRGVVN